jgi:hypothetical protein
MNENKTKVSLLQFQLDLIMKEIDLIDNTIGRLDELLLRNRNWRTTLWAESSSSFSLSETGLRTVLYSGSSSSKIAKISLLMCERVKRPGGKP